MCHKTASKSWASNNIWNWINSKCLFNKNTVCITFLNLRHGYFVLTRYTCTHTYIQINIGIQLNERSKHVNCIFKIIIHIYCFFECHQRILTFFPYDDTSLVWSQTRLVLQHCYTCFKQLLIETHFRRSFYFFKAFFYGQLSVIGLTRVNHRW